MAADNAVGKLVHFSGHFAVASCGTCQSLPAMKIHPVIPPGTRTLRGGMKPRRAVVNSRIDIENAAIRTAKPQFPRELWVRITPA